MAVSRKKSVLEELLEKIELPEGAYEKAEQRYLDIGEWLQRDGSTFIPFSPHVFSQGSFRLGTANKPDKDNEYDLDLGCNLREGLTKVGVSQEQLKNLVGSELELYRQARGIKENLAEKRRCWRLDYADGLSFHMDIVPCIPESGYQREGLKKRMVESSQLDESLAKDVAELAVSITDNEDTGYTLITDSWRISNPEGYARWFESRMRSASQYIVEREILFKASIDELPYYQWKTPLQGAIQLLKRHRDTMFKDNDDSKPISVIITTLAAKAYQGEGDLASSILNILNAMGGYINQTVPLVPNPVNPDEDFADKWYSPEHTQLRLKENFSRWLIQAKSDFAALCSTNDSRLVIEAANQGLDIGLDGKAVDRMLGITIAAAVPVSRIKASDPRPWLKV